MLWLAECESAEVRESQRPDVTAVEIVGGIEKRELIIAKYNFNWPVIYRRHEARIRAALDATALQIEHIGSTAVPGLAAKPIIDILVAVGDITAEEEYLAPLLAAGYRLRVREPGHRMVRTPELDVHVHILQIGDDAAGDYLLLRDHLRHNAADRELYERTKRSLAAMEWRDMNAYADAKTDVVTEIKNRARQQDRG